MKEQTANSKQWQSFPVHFLFDFGPKHGMLIEVDSFFVFRVFDGFPIKEELTD